jgi:hypothetical protein
VADHLASFDRSTKAGPEITLPLAPGEAFDGDDTATLTLDISAATASQPQCPASDATGPQAHEVSRIIHIVQHDPPVEVGASQSSHETPSGLLQIAGVRRCKAERLGGSSVRLQHRKARSGVADPNDLLRSKVLQNCGRQPALADPCGPGQDQRRTPGRPKGLGQVLLNLTPLETAGQQWWRVGKEGV